jgi:hypothetical protein
LQATFKDSAAYLEKFRALQTKLFFILRREIVEELQNIFRPLAASISAANASAAASGNMAAANPLLSNAALVEASENALNYAKLKASSEKVRPLIAILEERNHVAHTTLRECQETYAALRLASLLPPNFNVSLQSLASSLRVNCIQLLTFANNESSLWSSFFEDSSAGLSSLLMPYCNRLADALRPLILRSKDTDLLCSLVDILRTEIIQEQIIARGIAHARCSSDIREKAQTCRFCFRRSRRCSAMFKNE